MNEYIESFLELLYPEKNTCFVCNNYDESISDKYICKDCENKLKKLELPLCLKCSKPIHDISNNFCTDCKTNERAFETSKSLYSYEGMTKISIYDFKYHNKPYFYRMFGNLLLNYMKENNYTSFDCITSVPLHKSKLRIRGYNQAELMAKYLSCKLSIPYADTLKRIKKTTKQSQHNKNERRMNIKDAFEIKNQDKIKNIKNSSVLLVDDVFTTGATAHECSKALLGFGVAKVSVITIAR